MTLTDLLMIIYRFIDRIVDKMILSKTEWTTQQDMERRALIWFVLKICINNTTSRIRNLIEYNFVG